MFNSRSDDGGPVIRRKTAGGAADKRLIRQAMRGEVHRFALYFEDLAPQEGLLIGHLRTTLHEKLGEEVSLEDSWEQVPHKALISRQSNTASL